MFCCVTAGLRLLFDFAWLLLFVCVVCVGLLLVWLLFDGFASLLWFVLDFAVFLYLCFGICVFAVVLVFVLWLLVGLV